MPSILNAPLSGGVTITSDTSGVLQLQTASTTALTIDGSQNVGIGTSSIVGRFTVSQGTKATTAAVTNIAGFNTTDASSLGLFVRQKLDATAANRYMGLTSFDNSVGSAPLVLQDLGSPVLIGTTTNNGNGGILQLSGGITFPATQSASSDANTLDDYEEGTWTPTVTSTGGTITTVSATGSYTKIGQIVVIRFSTVISNVGTASGTIIVNGLPFTSVSANNQSIGLAREQQNTGNYYQSFIPPSATNMLIRGQGDSAVSWINNANYVTTITYIAT